MLILIIHHFIPLPTLVGPFWKEQSALPSNLFWVPCCPIFHTYLLDLFLWLESSHPFVSFQIFSSTIVLLIFFLYKSIQSSTSHSRLSYFRLFSGNPNCWLSTEIVGHWIVTSWRTCATFHRKNETNLAPPEK